MKRLIYLLLPAILLLAGCKQDEPVMDTPPQPQQEETYIEWADNPFWGSISDQLEQMGLLNTWNAELNLDPEDPAPGGGDMNIDNPGGVDAPSGDFDKWKIHQDRLTYVSWGVTVFAIAVDIADLVCSYGSKASAAATTAIQKLNQALLEIQGLKNYNKDVLVPLSKRIERMSQIINDVCLKEVVRRQEIDFINQQYRYINECHDRGYYNLTFATPYWNEMMAINKRYQTDDDIAQMDDATKLSYYREVYALLSEWAQPDYTNVFEAVNYAHYLCSQQGSGMPAIYTEWAKKACLWSFERQDMLTHLAYQDITVVIFIANLANAYLHACQYLHVGMETHVAYNVEKQLKEQVKEMAKVYEKMLNEIKKSDTRQCFIPGAEFATKDSVLTAIPYQKPTWAQEKNYSPELLVYGYNNKDAQTEKNAVISDSIANLIISFYGNRYTLAQVLISQGGFMVPKGYEQTSLSNIEILASSEKMPKGDVVDGLAPIYVSGGFNKAQRADKHLTRWMGTAIIINNQMKEWADFASPSVWMTVHGIPKKQPKK